jgi:hypothetical protein
MGLVREMRVDRMMLLIDYMPDGSIETDGIKHNKSKHHDSA